MQSMQHYHGNGGSSQAYGWGEMVVPLQTFTIDKSCLQPPQKYYESSFQQYKERLISSIQYKVSSCIMDNLSLLTPFLQVNSWDSKNGKLELLLDLQNPLHLKLVQFQEHILDMLVANQIMWLGTTYHTRESLYNCFRPMIVGNICNVYLHGNNNGSGNCGRVWIYKNGSWSKGVNNQSFQKNDVVRIALRFQGLCYLGNPYKNNKLMFRLQHQTLGIFHKGS